MRRFTTIFISAALALALPLTAFAGDHDIDKVLGSVRVDANQQAGDVSTVNGSVHVGDGARVQKASTVNGSVELGDKAQASSLETVNGTVTLGSGSRVAGEVTTVNGTLRLGQGADVAGKLSNVNGNITLDAANVAGGIDTVTGDITVGANSHVEGGILVEKSTSMIHWGNDRPPVIVIGPHAVVQGTLDFEREVVLKVSDSALIGAVKGATPVKFSGATP
jgi:polyisoprenoid-binding protein YceI